MHARALRRHGVPCAGLCTTAFFGGDLDEERFLRAVDDAFTSIGGSGVVEIGTHPAYADSALEARSYYVAARENELCILTLPSLRARLEERDVTLTTASSLLSQSPPASDSVPPPR
jgi:predicted glycoside hydrolase/deacetylase ChbG (UPF0249 family)